MTLHEHLSKLIGEWETSGIVIDGGEYDGTKIKGTDRYEWLGEQFIVHNADVLFGSQPQRTVEIIKLNEDSFDLTAYNSDGSIETMHGTFDDNVYHAGDGNTRTALTFLDHASTMKAHWESHVTGEWKPWLDMSFRKKQ